MGETLLQQDALILAQKNMADYFATHDVKYVAEDAVFINQSTGESYKGKAEIGGMLHFMYKIAFKAKMETSNVLITEDKALVEGLFVGEHIGEIASLAPTNKKVSVPIAVTYDLKNGLIKEARIYFLESVLLQQLGVSPAVH